MFFKRLRFFLLILLVASGMVAMVSCEDVTENQDGENGQETRDDIYDIDARGVPQFVQVVYIDLSKIYRISRFRSAVGHDYSDDFESCRSMKHYFQPKSGVNWAGVAIYSPVAGRVARVEAEWAGQRIEIESSDYPAFRFIISHVNPFNPLQVGEAVTAGQSLGTHIGPQTYSDMAVGVSTPNGWKLISYIETLTAAAFQAFRNRGLSSRGTAVIGRAARDADPLACAGESFINFGNLIDWVVLN
jgi:hypothetical protein